MAVLCGVLFLDGLDVSMVGMALPSIEADLGLTTSQLQWVVSGYILGYGGFLLLGGRAADLVGRRRVLLIALGVFTVASAVGGVVNDGTLLVITRFLKGAAAAFTAPAGLSIITTHFVEGPLASRAWPRGSCRRPSSWAARSGWRSSARSSQDARAARRIRPCSWTPTGRRSP